MKRLGLLTFSIVAALALTACSEEKADATTTTTKTSSSASQASTPAVQPSKCVACGEANGATMVMVAYKGKDQPMCCASCAKQFNAMSDKDKDAKVAAAMYR